MTKSDSSDLHYLLLNFNQHVNIRNFEKLKPEKNSDPNGIRTHDLCDTGAALYQLSYQANWELAILWVSLVLFIFYGYITNSQNSQLPVGLIAQLAEHCTGIAEVIGSNPVQAWIFFRL